MKRTSAYLLIAVCLVLSPVVSGLACTAQYQCASVASDFNYVQCVNGQCQCLTANGFNGTATTTDKCRCDYNVAWGGNPNQPYCIQCTPPRAIQYYQGMPYCVNPPECQSLEQASDRNTIISNKVRQVYQRLLYPTPLLIITGQQNVNDLFAPDVKGRVSPVGSFDDFTAVEEYFYGLGASSQITQITVKKLTVTGNYVSIWVVIFFNGTATGQPSYNLTQTGFYTFDSNNLISSVDLDILNLGWALDGDTLTNNATRQAIINNVCGALVGAPGHPGTCPQSADPTGYYSSISDCQRFMNSIPFGTWAHGNANSVICRQLHTILTVFRPSVHCPHAGKTGGMKCVDTPYSSFYDEDF